jgi:hypothetical protein
MLPGLPHFCKRGAKTPIKAPVPMIPQRDAKNFRNIASNPPFFGDFYSLLLGIYI